MKNQSHIVKLRARVQQLDAILSRADYSSDTLRDVQSSLKELVSGIQSMQKTVRSPKL